MLPSGTPSPISGAQSVPTSLLRSNSGLLGSQGSQMPAQSSFPSLLSPRMQINNTHVSSLISQSFANGSPGNGGAEPDPMSNMGNTMSFSSTLSSMAQPSMQDQQLSQNQQQPHMFPNNQQPINHNCHQHQQQQQQQQQQQYQSIRGLNGVGPVKLEPQVMNDQHPMRIMGSVKLEPQLQNIRNLPPVKMEPQNQDQSQFLHHQQQQQQLLHMSRQSPQAAAQINYLHQQRLMQLQQKQQQMALRSVPLQRSSSQVLAQQQNLPSRPNVRPVYEPGTCARRLARYMYEQQHRPGDNNIEFWRKFVLEFFAPGAKKKWCVSLYGSGRQTTAVFPQDVWHCEICNRKPGRGFEATAEVLPRLFKIKYESGTLEELLYVDMPKEYQNNSGQIVLDYAKAIQESVFDQLRVVRDGQLRIVFSPELKICSWEFCAQRHEELIPRRLLIPQVSQLGAAAQKYQAATQSAPSTMSVPELQNNCNMFVSSARQLAKALEVPLVNDLGYTKRYVRCLQISEVVNSMKDLIDYSRETGTGPMESLAKFPRRTSSTTAGFPDQSQIKEEPNLQQGQNSSNNDHNSYSQANTILIASTNGVPIVNNPLNTSATSSNSTIVGLLHQESMNLRNNPNGSYIGNGIQMPSPNSSSTIPQPNPSPFQTSTPTTSNNNSNQVSHLGNDANDSQSSVQKILQGIMMGPGNAGNNGIVKNENGVLSSSNINKGAMGNGFAQSTMLNGIRATVGSNGNNAMSSMNGRAGLAAMAREQNMNQQQGLGDQFLSGLGAVNGFNNLQFDWKPSP